MRFNGTAWSDVYVGGGSNDLIAGKAGNDRLFGGAGADRITGGAGNDLLSSNRIIDTQVALMTDPDTEVDRLDGGDGDDFIGGGYGDILIGGSGIDTLSLDLRGAGVGLIVDLSAVSGNRAVRIGRGSLSGFEQYGVITLGAFADVIRLGDLISTRMLGGGVYAGGGDDWVEAGRNGAILNGGDGNDTLFGSAVGDDLFGGAGDDRLVSRGGRDELHGGDGNDILDLRGADSSRVTGGAGSDVMILDGKRADWYVVANFYDGIDIGVSGRGFHVGDVEQIRFDDGAVRIRDLLPGVVFGTDGNDRLIPGKSGFGGAMVTDRSDTLYGRDGDDLLDGGIGGDLMYGGDGHDTFIVNETTDRVVDGSYDDIVLASASFVGETMFDGVGRVVLVGNQNIDATEYRAAFIVGNAGDNRLNGNGVLEGGDGDDTITSRNGNGTASYEHASGPVVINLAIQGQQNTRGAGIDMLENINRVIGSAFNDQLLGSQTEDTIEGGGGNDRINGREGDDTASYAGASAGVVVSTAIVGQQDTIGAGRDTLISIEHLFGSQFGDTLTGDEGFNYLNGEGGDDVIHMGLGGDVVDGGFGSDRFVFDSADFGHSTIFGLDGDGGDRIDLSAIDANPGTDGDQAFRVVVAFGGHAGELVYHATDGYPTLVEGDVDGDGITDFSIAIQNAPICVDIPILF